MKHKFEYLGYDIEDTEDGITIKGDDGIKWRIGRTLSMEGNKELIESFIETQEDEKFYKSKHFTDEFNRHLETVILATRHSGSAAIACRDALLSLYNGDTYKANLYKWYGLDSDNRAALLFVLEHQTASNRQDIDLYLPQYQDDFNRMKNEIAADDRS